MMNSLTDPEISAAEIAFAHRKDASTVPNPADLSHLKSSLRCFVGSSYMQQRISETNV